MKVETHYTEYKDFSKAKKSDKKEVMGKLFKEISAFANTSGGKVIVGIDDNTKRENIQPDFVYSWLENDSLTALINNISDNLVVFHSYREDDLVYIKVEESNDVIMVGRDTAGLHKGECFVRENDKTIKATGKRLTELVKRKSISINQRLKKLRKIVHHKFQTGDNQATKMNIFDSLFVTLKSEEPYINSVFDNLKMNEFVLGYSLPISKHSTIQLHLELVAQLLKQKSMVINQAAFESLMKSDHNREKFFEAHKNEVVSSEQFKAYLMEYNHLF